MISRAKNRVKHWVVEGKFFENLGLYYLGPVDGHDIYALKMIFERANEIDGPVLVHVQTQKGKGYEPAEKEPGRQRSRARLRAPRCATSTPRRAWSRAQGRTSN